MTVARGNRRGISSSEGVVSGFVERESLVVISTAIMETAVAGLASDLLAFWPMPTPPLVVALFEDRASFDSQKARLDGFAASGATVVVGLPGPIRDLSPSM